MIIDDSVSVEEIATDDLREMIVEEYKEYIEEADDGDLMFVIRRLGSSEEREFAVANMDAHIAEWYRRVSVPQAECKS